jgi:hypothetical protein
VYGEDLGDLMLGTHPTTPLGVIKANQSTFYVFMTARNRPTFLYSDAATTGTQWFVDGTSATLRRTVANECLLIENRTTYTLHVGLNMERHFTNNKVENGSNTTQALNNLSSDVMKTSTAQFKLDRGDLYSTATTSLWLTRVNDPWAFPVTSVCLIFKEPSTAVAVTLDASDVSSAVLRIMAR